MPLRRRQAREGVKFYWGYMRLLQHALFKLPKCGAGTIFRGIKAPSPPITLAQLEEAAASGEPWVWWGFSSTSTSRRPGWQCMQELLTAAVGIPATGTSTKRHKFVAFGTMPCCKLARFRASCCDSQQTA